MQGFWEWTQSELQWWENYSDSWGLHSLETLVSHRDEGDDAGLLISLAELRVSMLVPELFEINMTQLSGQKWAVSPLISD